MTSAWTNRRTGSRAKNRIWAICTILMLATIPAAIHAQAYYGSIVGNVTDVTGAVIVGAKVAVTNTATDVSFNTVTSSIGAFSLAQLPVGTYTVTITAPNFSGNGAGLTNVPANAINGGFTTNILIGGHTLYITNGIIMNVQ